MELQKNKPSKPVDKSKPKHRPGGQAGMESQMNLQANKPSKPVDKNAKAAEPRPNASKMTPENGLHSARTSSRKRSLDDGLTMRPMPMLAGKVAIVTRSTDGIGLGIRPRARGRRRERHARWLGRRARGGESARRHGGGVCRLGRDERWDMSRPDHVRSVVRRTIEQFGGIDILVNNVVVQRMAPLEGFPDDDWDAVVALNLSAVFHATKATLPQMRQRNWGRIINNRLHA
jgi:hypothetical protein